MPKTLLRPGSGSGTGNTTAARQIADRYVGTTRGDTTPTPDVVRQIITTYTAPGDTVCDPDPGPGLVLAEAIRAGRKAVGFSPQPRWESALEANLDRARLAGPVGTTTLLESVDDPSAAELHGAVDLVLTALPHTPGSDPNRMLVELYEDLDAVADWVWPGGHIVITCRPWRRHGRLLDLPGTIHEAADAIGLIPTDHGIALTAPRKNRVRPRIVSRVGHLPEGTDIHGCPTTFPTHIDVLVFRLPTTTRRDETPQRGTA